MLIWITIQQQWGKPAGADDVNCPPLTLLHTSCDGSDRSGHEPLQSLLRSLTRCVKLRVEYVCEDVGVKRIWHNTAT